MFTSSFRRHPRSRRLISREVMKGASTHALNEARDRAEAPTFAWQAEYGVLSFGEQALAEVVAYVENQPARHADRRVWSKLERIADDTRPA